VSLLSLPVGIATRVLGDLAAVAVAARAIVPAAEKIASVEFDRVQEDLHVLAQTARELPRVESTLTERLDQAETTVVRAIAAAEAVVDGMPQVVAGVEELRLAREAAAEIVAALPVVAEGVAELRRAADAAEKLIDGLDEVRASREALVDARGQAAELIAAAARAQVSLDRASDNVEAALARAEPLQGLAERVGRLSERLPGGGRGGSQG
jgi:hypothetical protein